MVQSIDVCEGSNNLITAVNKDGALPPDGNKSIKWGEMEFEPNKINLKYDRNGNLTNDGVRSYFYDAENRLIKCNTSILLVNYKYDGLGRKVLEQESKDGAIFQENSFIYDGWSCVLELKTENLTLKTKSYIWGLDLSGTLQGAGGVGGLLSVNSPFSKGGGGGFYFYCYDGNGNVINLVNIDTKEIAAHYEYDPFGRLIEKEGSYADRNFYRFSTKRVSKVFGIYDYGMRWYDPNFARWLTRDPIGVKGGLNLYGFVGNNPVSYYDLLGLTEKCKVFVFWSHKTDAKNALNDFNEAAGDCSAAGALGCFTDGTNPGEHQIDNFPNSSSGFIGVGKKSARIGGNGGYNQSEERNITKRTAKGFAKLIAKSWEKALLQGKKICKKSCKCHKVIVQFKCASPGGVNDGSRLSSDLRKRYKYAGVSGNKKMKLNLGKGAVIVKKYPICNEKVEINCNLCRRK